ncbi:DUF1640 domain-containing protein [Yersinia enterocolitica]|uniref:DUF1640 domain-containing protein n=1 Tax=Yersinia enterocolitica TaxID=630 RepID=A0AAD2V4U8_YEREN|nr:DUF1640 domain-containing protein [Yersinia enterocolitica]EKN3715423.1 DUF1640 domain-containing protein [Yersinia enterocolitica]EKN5074385.1 DUF1640 domain-containing protein [Yersinia enterocolitica]EKN6209112.1 DUF1640 domain-containing protein [Yersinia enterocolitica]ELI8104581.1 DUF1640 domain-containing protein [Yersinia enterocolitica]ELI8237649.1 DUF1640 domain-containing protein [Yersinia enterocolitica]
MDESRRPELGEMTISYQNSKYDTPLTVNVKSVHRDDFMTFIQTGVNAVNGVSDSVITGVPIQAQATKVFFETNTTLDSIGPSIITNEAEINDVVENENTLDINMSDLNRNEMQALLKANKAEVDAVASRMQADMAKWRELMSSDMKDIKNLVSSQHDKISSRLDIQSVRIETALDSHSRKIDAALSIQEAKMEGKLSDVKLDIIKWALGIPALAFTVYKIYGAVSGNPTP